MRYYNPFPKIIPLSEAGCSRVTHPSATKNLTEAKFSVRLACVKRAASVRPEPGSNSLLSLYFNASSLQRWNLYPVNSFSLLTFSLIFFKSTRYPFILFVTWVLFFPFFRNISLSLVIPYSRNFRVSSFRFVCCSIFKVLLFGTPLQDYLLSFTALVGQLY